MDAVVLGASPNALSVARSLGRAGLTVAAVATTTHHPMERSRYVKEFHGLVGADDETVCRCLEKLATRENKPFLIATGDQYALLVAKHQRRLEQAYCFNAPSYETLDAIIDKSKLYETARRCGLRHPSFYVVKDAADIDEAVAKVNTPCYIKPALAHRWRLLRNSKLERADDARELRRILEEAVADGLVTIPQEIIPGGDDQVFSVCTYIDRSGNPVAFRTKRKLRQYPLDAGDACAQEIYEGEDSVAELGLRLLAATGHRGAATVEFRKDPRDGAFVLMEINARTILGQEMITRSGLDVPLIAYCDARGLPLPPPSPPKRTRWVNFSKDYRAFRDLHRRGNYSLGRWLASVLRSNAFAYFSVDDPLPWLTRTFARSAS